MTPDEHKTRILASAEAFNRILEEAREAGVRVNCATMVNGAAGTEKIVVREIVSVLHGAQ